MSRPRRLVIVVNDAGFFLSHRLPLALGAAKDGWDVHVAVPPSPEGQRILDAGIALHSIALTRRGTSFADQGRTLASVVDLYRRLAPDVVHHVTAKPVLLGGIAARLARVPSVVHAVTGLGYVFISQAPRARAIRAAVRAGYRIATAHPNCAVIFQNEDDRRVLGSAIRTERQVLVPGSGVDLERFAPRPLPDGVPLVVLPARLLWDKGIAELAEAAKRLRARGVPIRVALVGGLDPGNPAAVPREQVEAWVRNGVLEWWGPRDDIPDVLAQASIVCLPSYREGMPKTLLEACAAGRPIVTTDVPGCRDAVRGAGCAEVVPARDASALADALELLATNRGLRERRAEAAAIHGRQFDVRKVVATTLGLYDELMSRARRRS